MQLLLIEHTLFMNSMNKLLTCECKKAHPNRLTPIFYLVIEKGSYCAMAFFEEKYHMVKIPSLETKGYNSSSWRINDCYGE